VIAYEKNHGDAHILLANIYLLIHYDLFPERAFSKALLYAWAVINHWWQDMDSSQTKDKYIGNKLWDRIWDLVSNSKPLENGVAFENLCNLDEYCAYDEAIKIETLYQFYKNESETKID
jgi:hypothetical protein